MADAPTFAAPTARLAAEEGRRRELELARRSAREDDGGVDRSAPIPIDKGVLGVPFARRAALDLQRQGFGSFGGRNDADEGGGSQAVDQATAREALNQRMQTGLMKARAVGQRGGPGASGGGGSGGASLGGAAAMLGGAAGGGQGGSAGQVLEGIGQKLGSSILKTMWEWIIPSFGHTIWIIDLLFFMGWSSKFFRRWIPEVGHEWIPPNIRKNIPPNFLKPLKYGELTAIFVVSFIIGIADLMIIVNIILMITIIMAVAGA